MGVVQLPDDLMRVIEQRVANGQAANPTAFVQEAVSRLLDDAEAGRTTTIATTSGEQALHDRLTDRLRDRFDMKE